MTTHVTHTQIDEERMFSAIDIGTTKVVALTGYTNEQGEMVVLGHGVVSSKNLDIDKEKEQLNAENISNAVHKAVDAARNEAGFFCKKVVVGTAGRFMRSYQNRIEFKRSAPYNAITHDEIERQCKQKLIELIAFDEEMLHLKKLHYILDEQFYTEAPVGKTGASLAINVCVIKVKSSYLQQLRLLMEHCGLEVIEFMLEPLASGAAVLSQNDRNQGCAIVDIGGGTTDIALYENGFLQFAEVIPFGGNTITNDICKLHIINNLGDYNEPYDTDEWKIAEHIKIQCGKCISEETDAQQTINIPAQAHRAAFHIPLADVVQTVQNRMNEIIDAIHSLIDYAQCSCMKQGIVITGGGAELKQVAALFEQKLQCPVRIAAPNHIVRTKTFDANQPRYATVVGLLMRAAEIHADTYVPPVVQHVIVEEKPQSSATVETTAQPVAKVEQKPVEQAKPQPAVEQKPKKNFGSFLKNKVNDIAGSVFADNQDEE
ncbi:MAG: cell division protein FtsA [Bacteroidales bacterium]|jgi:cell division protein FtsA|nr:cell division protein FtsA [Bacteroidales bacterium]